MRRDMIQKSFLSGTLLASLFMTENALASFFGEHARGWHWYEVLPVQEEMEHKEGEQASSTSRPQTPTEQVKAWQHQLENRLHAALVNPTPHTVRLYQEMQRDIINRSKLFSTVWMQNVFQNPGLDHTLVSPVNQQGRLLQIDLEKNRTFEVIKKLSETYGLFFFFAGACPYCHEFAPIVKRFADTYGWEVIAISVDGGSMEAFPEAQPDNGLFHAWDIRALPALFAVNPTTQKVLPVAYGLTSLDEMERRIVLLTEKDSQGSKGQETSQIVIEGIKR